MFSGESWGNPPGGYTCLLVPSLRENKPSKTLLKATGKKQTGSFNLNLGNWGKACRISELNLEVGVLGGGEVLLN